MPQTITQELFSSLLTHYYSAWFRFHPEAAVHVGIEGYEDQLTPFDDENIGALISLNQKIISSLEELNTDELSAAQQIDFTVLYNAASIELHELLERDWRFFSPQKFLPLEAIHQLIQRPIENVHKALKHRLEAIPDYMRAAKAFLLQTPQNIPADWVKDAVISARSGAVYFRSLMHDARVLRAFQNPGRLQPLCDSAATAMEDFEKFLNHDLLPKAEGDFACGKDHFSQLLNNWHELDISIEQLYAFGDRLFRETQQALQNVATELTGESVEEVLDNIRQQHPSNDSEALLNTYRTQMQAAYQFIKKHELMSVPENQQLKVIETPVFLRHEIPFAAYEEPSYNDEQQQGYYYVTPVRAEGQLLEHNWTSIDLTCVHEAFPGHHLQFVTANQNPENSLPRMLNASATLYEGWALYCEDLMQEQGFLNKPEHKFIMLRDRLWRALRVMLDVELHTRGLDINTAAQRMRDELGFDIDQAKADLSWYSHAPTVPMGYAVGWALIKALREDEEKKDGFNLKQFHDRLLSVGSCALPLVIKSRFGEAAWQAVREKVFPETM